MHVKTLADAFYETLKDLYFAEKQSVRALKKSTKRAKHPAMIEAFQKHTDHLLTKIASQLPHERHEASTGPSAKEPRSKTPASNN